MSEATIKFFIKVAPIMGTEFVVSVTATIVGLIIYTWLARKGWL